MRAPDTKRAMTNLRWATSGLSSCAQKLAALAQQKMICHSCDVITNYAVQWLAVCLFGILPGQSFRMQQEKAE